MIDDAVGSLVSLLSEQVLSDGIGGSFFSFTLCMHCAFHSSTKVLLE